MTDEPLGHRSEGVERQARYEKFRLVLLHREVSHLRSIPVGDDDSPSSLVNRRDGLHHPLAVREHLFVGAGLALEGDRIPSECDDRSS